VGSREFNECRYDAYDIAGNEKLECGTCSNLLRPILVCFSSVYIIKPRISSGHYKTHFQTIHALASTCHINPK